MTKIIRTMLFPTKCNDSDFRTDNTNRKLMAMEKIKKTSPKTKPQPINGMDPGRDNLKPITNKKQINDKMSETLPKVFNLSPPVVLDHSLGQ